MPRKKKTKNKKNNITMKIKSILASVVILASMASCKSYMSVPYFQDLKDANNLPALNTSKDIIRIQTGDKLNIVVSSALSPEMATGFNLPLQSQRIGAVGSGYSNSYSTMPYLVDTKGNIDFPIVGKIRVAGMTREEIEETVKNILVSQHLLNDAVVTCEVLNHYVNVLGDVKTPGRIHIEKDNLTIIEALSMCGDLNITGERQPIVVIRNEGGQQKVYHIDLTSAEDVYKSEAYYLKPDDLVYVNPNETKQRTSMPAGNSWQTPSVYFSLTSIALSLTTLIVSLSRK